jgi:hypothetical protein
VRVTEMAGLGAPYRMLGACTRCQARVLVTTDRFAGFKDGIKPSPCGSYQMGAKPSTENRGRTIPVAFQSGAEGLTR